MTFDDLKPIILILTIFAPAWLALSSDDIRARKARKEQEKEYYNLMRDDIKPYSPPKPKAKPKKEEPKKTETKKEEPEKPKRPTISQETLAAMHKQADTERAIAEALERKAKHVSDPVKRARIEKQAANSWVRFNVILDKLDKLESSE